MLDNAEPSHKNRPKPVKKDPAQSAFEFVDDGAVGPGSNRINGDATPLSPASPGPPSLRFQEESRLAGLIKMSATVLAGLNLPNLVGHLTSVEKLANASLPIQIAAAVIITALVLYGTKNYFKNWFTTHLPPGRVARLTILAVLALLALVWAFLTFREYQQYLDAVEDWRGKTHTIPRTTKES